MDVEVAGLRVSPPTQPTLVRPLLSVSPHMSLKERRDGELLLTGGTLEGNLDREPCRGGRGHSRRRGEPPAWLSLDMAQLILNTSHALSSDICLPFSHGEHIRVSVLNVKINHGRNKNKPNYNNEYIST